MDNCTCLTFSFLFPLCSFYTNVRRNILHAIVYILFYNLFSDLVYTIVSLSILLYSFPFCTCINVFLLINTCLYIQMCRRSFFYTKLSTNTFLHVNIYFYKRSSKYICLYIPANTYSAFVFFMFLFLSMLSCKYFLSIFLY